jgi:surfactin synthase thioesterase subunit
MKKLLPLLVLIAAFLAVQSGAQAQKKDAKVKTTATKGGDDKKVSKGDDLAVGKTTDGKTVFEGSKGGHYYLNDKGDKTYVKDFVGAKIVGKTKDGQNIFAGPKGGKFYYSAKGDKVYVKGK